MEGVGAFLANDFQVRLPHVGADEDNLGSHFVADGSEEALKGFDRSFLPNPEQACDAEIDLVDERQMLLSFGVLDFVDSDGINLARGSMFQSKGDDLLDGVENLFP